MEQSEMQDLDYDLKNEIVELLDYDWKWFLLVREYLIYNNSYSFIYWINWGLKS